MSCSTPQNAQEQAAPSIDDALENESPNRTKAALRSVMKTASKPQRVPADLDEISPMPLRVLRDGKKMKAAPRLPKASRVELTLENTKPHTSVHCIPLPQQSQPEAIRLPALQLTIPGEELLPLPGNHMLGGVTSQKELLQEVQASPTALVGSLQQLQLSENALESQLLCHESLADTSSRVQQASSFPHAPEPGSVSKAAECSMQTSTPPLVPETDSQAAAASSQTPEHRANAEVTEVSGTPAPVGAVSETGEHAPALTLTPDVARDEASVSTPLPAKGASETEDAAVSVPTPQPAPSPQLPRASDFITPPPQILDDKETPEVDASHHLQQATPDEALKDSLEDQVSCERQADVSSYIPRAKKTPFMKRKLRALQAKEWTDQDAGKVHKSRLEREKEAAAAARKDSLSFVDRAAARRLVQSTFAKVASTQGKDLSETMVVHKSRLEREKEAAAAISESALEASPGQDGSAGQARQRKSLPGSSFAGQGPAGQGWRRTSLPGSSSAGQGLGDMKTHMSRLEKDRAAAVAKKAAGVASPAVESRMPSYMRQTAASAAMQKEGRLGENMKVHKSQLEKDCEKALALQAARKKAGHNPLTPFPVKRASVAKPRLSFGTLGGLPVHKSKLEKAKDAAAAASAAALMSRLPKPAASSRASTMPGAGLGDMKPHKSRLEREKEAWQRQADAEGTAKPTGAMADGSEGSGRRREGFSDFVPN